MQQEYNATYTDWYPFQNGIVFFILKGGLRIFVRIIKDSDRKQMNTIALLIASIDEPIDKMNGKIRSVSRYYYKFVSIQ